MEAVFPTIDYSRRQIRLLSIGDDEGSSPSYALSVFDFSTCPEYFALSYVWGSASFDREIMLNGSKVAIRENLFLALKSIKKHIQDARQSRSSSSVPVQEAKYCQEDAGPVPATMPMSCRYCWIDALCIDQQCEAERTHQVRLMSEIYSGASFVLAWLGPECEQALHEASTAVSTGNHIVFIPYTDQLQHSALSKSLLPLLKAKYWTRIWIVQEFVLAKDVVFASGDRLASWDTVNRVFPDFYATHCTGEFGKAITLVNERRQHTFRLRQSIKPDLHDLIQRFGSSACSDVRDKVFALLGILRHSSGWAQNKVIWDYSLSPRELEQKVLLVAANNGLRSEALRRLAEWLRYALELGPVDTLEIERIVESGHDGKADLGFSGPPPLPKRAASDDLPRRRPPPLRMASLPEGNRSRSFPLP